MGYVSGSTTLALGQHVVLAQPTDDASDLAAHLAAAGEGIFSFGIAVRDLGGERERLAALRVGVVEDPNRPGWSLSIRRHCAVSESN